MEPTPETRSVLLQICEGNFWEWKRRSFLQFNLWTSNWWH